MDNFIITYTGKKFTLQEPQFDILDIAHALSNTCRFGGHCKKFYSVAEHSVLVMHLMEKLHQEEGASFEGLMHDATEAYLSDVPSPFKQFIPDWKKLEDDLELSMRRWAGLPDKENPLVKQCDLLALFIEARALLPDEGISFADPFHLRTPAMELALDSDFSIWCDKPDRAFEEFMNCYDNLKEEIQNV